MINEEISSLKEDLAEPWLIDQRSFFPSENQENIAENLQELKDNHAMLTLVAAHGKVYSNVVLINIAEGKLQIDKPLDWVENGDAFRIFYRDQDDYWCFFYSADVAAEPFSIAIDIPGRLFYLQRRRHKRIPVPVGTRAMVKKNGNDLMKTVYVMDISAAGMLFCNGALADEFPVDSFIKDIIVSIPPLQEKADGTRRLSPLIRKGRVVRTFVDNKTKRSCYGISFEYDSSDVQQSLCRMISEIAVCA